MKTCSEVKKLFSLFVGITAISLSSITMSIEEPSFEVIEQYDDIELRQYDSFIVAETIVTGDVSRSKASNQGFMRLFGYITGDNTGSQKIEMTAPVIQTNDTTPGMKIDMTAPVQQRVVEEGWLVSFVLPAEFTLQSAPLPTDSRVTLREVSGRTMAVKQFSGRWKDKNIGNHHNLLMQELEIRNINAISEVEFAAYNAPFTLPFMRRNEVMVEVEYSGQE